MPGKEMSSESIMTNYTNRSYEIESTKELRTVMQQYFDEIGKAAIDKERKVAWCTSIGPCELLHAMGFDVYYPENHGALLGATRSATELISYASAEGYSQDICSYLTSDIGAFLKGVTPLKDAYGIKTVPKADVLLYNNNQCREVQDWFKFYARHWGVPTIGINSPRVLDDVKDSHLIAVVGQIKDLIPILEKISGNRFDIDKLREIVRISKECTIRWRKVLEYAATIPTPMTFYDHCIHMAPAVILRGRQAAIDYYDILLAELEKAVDSGKTAIPKEHHRIYWDGMPIWGRLRMISELMLDLKTAIVASTYCNSWIFDQLDPQQPIESMARASLECFNVRSEDFKETYIEKWIEYCNIQGIIFHDAKTCPYNTNSRFAMPARLSKKLGIPTIVINGDLNDLRCFSEEQSKTNIEAFIEQLSEIAA
jgi:benzoyl-CoA reductase/2-hydroxyglutaryl-CoA dehydratase subunit BcrC/BadD/HgdB